MNYRWSCPQSPNLSISMDFCLLLMISLRLLNPTTHVTISLTEFVRRRKWYFLASENMLFTVKTGYCFPLCTLALFFTVKMVCYWRLF